MNVALIIQDVDKADFKFYKGTMLCVKNGLLKQKAPGKAISHHGPIRQTVDQVRLLKLQILQIRGFQRLFEAVIERNVEGGGAIQQSEDVLTSILAQRSSAGVGQGEQRIVQGSSNTSWLVVPVYKCWYLAQLNKSRS